MMATNALVKRSANLCTRVACLRLRLWRLGPRVRQVASGSQRNLDPRVDTLPTALRAHTVACRGHSEEAERNLVGQNGKKRLGVQLAPLRRGWRATGDRRQAMAAHLGSKTADTQICICSFERGARGG
jgi:hypothetical protein